MNDFLDPERYVSRDGGRLRTRREQAAVNRMTPK